MTSIIADYYVIDPKKVTRLALENAASIAGMLLTTECVIADEPEEAPAGGGMGGMMYYQVCLHLIY